MKILQIRGRNLASLAGDFSLDFERGPLADAGLFAISGPTGAGKSTLLDVLSLALYDRTPRLDSNSLYHLPDGPEESLGVQDPRNLLRRGTTEGLAEVRFVGTDGRRYRASWSVRRARGKLGGKLQAAELQLHDDESDQPLGRTKVEVLNATQRAVGLNFDQFRRSILLAQGDFAAFLRAKGDERSELLERMTGTELYTAVSRRAHIRAKELEEALRRQEEAARAVPILDPEARAAAQSALVELEKTVAGTASQLTVLREHKLWWIKLAELRQKRDDARTALDAATQRWNEAASRRQALADIERVQPLRALDKEATRAAEELDAADKHLKACESAMAQARADDEHAAAALTKASKDLEQRRAEHTTAKPHIDRARSLDQAIAEKARALEAGTKKLAQAEGDLALRSKEEQELTTRQAQVVTTLASLTKWVDDNAAAVALAANWRVGVAPQLQAFEKTHAAWKALGASVPGLQAAHAQAAEAQVQAQQRAAAAEASVATAQQRVQAAEADEAAHPEGNLAERRKALEAMREASTKLGQQHALAAQALKERQEREVEAAKVRKEGQDAETQAGQAAAARREVEQQLSATERLLEQLGLAAHRARLVDGEPCPLCGSTHHPGTGPVEETAAALEEQRRKQGARVAELQAQEAKGKATTEARATRALELDQEIARWQAAWQAAAEQWKVLGGPGDPTGVEASQWLESKGEAVNAEAKAIAELEHAATQRRKASADARKAHADATEQAGKARDALKAAEGLATTALAKRNEATAQVDAFRKVLDGTLVTLEGAFGGFDGWKVDLEADPAAFTEAWTARIDEASRNVQAKEEHTKLLTEVRTQVELHAGKVAQARQQRDMLQTERNQIQADHSGLLADRKEVLQGRPVAEVEAELAAGVKRCEEAYAAALKQSTQAREGTAKKTEAHKIALESVSKTGEARVRAAAALEQALASAAIDAATLRARLVHDEKWIAQERAALGELERVQSGQSKAFDERLKDLAAHEALTAPSVPLAEVEASLVKLEPQHTQQSQEVGAAKQRIEQDDRNRAAGEARARELEQARKDALVWQQLDTLIGSADGRKFRKFAQSLTMELLLAHANAE
ncbi:MAG: AAA family ATPase, partial [Rubrivivax sp.]